MTIATLHHNKRLKHFFLQALAVCLCLWPVSGAQARATIDHPFARLQSLDKITARTITFEAKVGSTIKFGPLYIKIRACRTAPDIEQPESAAFAQIWEVPEDAEPQWVFSGWMFASSPALSSMDHPIYDVWVLDCFNKEQAQTSDPVESASGDAKEGEGVVADDLVPAQPALEEETGE
jgi:hypothetical protein